MIRETHHFTSESEWLAMRCHDLTSTTIPGWLNASPTWTPFELWHSHYSGTGTSFKPNERSRWGNRMEPIIAAGAAEDNGWIAEPFKCYMRLPEHRIGSSFDWVAFDPETEERFLLEIKNVDSLVFRDQWTETAFGIEAPTHIEVQAQIEMLVSGIHHCKIIAMVGGNEAVVLDRKPDPITWETILEEAKLFWLSIEWGAEPRPNFYDDLATLSKLYGYAEPDKIINADDRMIQLMQEYKDFGRQEKVAEEEKKARKAELLTLIGDAEKVLAPGLTISASMVAATQVQAYERKAYRDFRVTEKRKPK